MDENPYAPPKAPLEGRDKESRDAPAARLYSPEQMAVAALLGGLIPVGIMAAANFRALGWARQAPLAILGSLVATVGMFFFGIHHPEIPVLVATGLMTLIAYGIVRPTFGGAVSRHREAGGLLASWWRVIGITLTWAVIVGVVAVAAITFLSRHGASGG